MNLVLTVSLIVIIVGDNSSAKWDQCHVCKCEKFKNYKHADCSRTNIREIITNIPNFLNQEIESLSLVAQPLKQITEVNLPNIISLNLENCYIKTVQKHAFRKLLNLKELLLSKNEIALLDSNTFLYNQHLKVLRLNDNNLTVIPENLFANLTRLQKLFLNNNHISTIHERAFVNNYGLESLHLENNYLKYLHPGVVENALGFFEIYLHGNPWTCDCHLKSLYSALKKKQLYFLKARCSEPEFVKGQVWIDLTQDVFVCLNQPAGNNTSVMFQNNAAVLSCEIFAETEPVVRWLFLNDVIDSDNSGGKYRFDTSRINDTAFWNNLTVYNVSTKDDGDYKCFTKNSGEKIFSLKVAQPYAPVILSPVGPTIGVDVETENFTIPCKVKSVPEPTTAWMFQNEIITNDSRTVTNNNTFMLNMSSEDDDVYWYNLTIPKTYLSYKGQYACTAQNSEGSIRKTIKLKVKFFRPPTVIILDELRGTSEGQNVTIGCRVEAVPKPDITWKFRHLVIDPKVSSRKYMFHQNLVKTGVYWNTLTILQVKDFEAGEYICVANNSQGTDRKSIQLVVNKRQETNGGISKETSVIYTAIVCILFAILAIAVLIKCSFRYYTAYNWKQEVTYRSSILSAN